MARQELVSGSSPLQIPQLEVACEDCGGTGKDPGDYLCVVCNGVGYILTDEGERLRNFFLHHIQPAMTDR